MEIKIKRNKNDKSPVTISYNFGASLEEAQQLFDGPTQLDRVVFGLFLVAAKMQLADFVRGLLKPIPVLDKEGNDTGKTKHRKLDEIQAEVASWKPTVERAAKRSVERARKIVAGLTPEERAVLLESLGGSSVEQAPADTAQTK